VPGDLQATVPLSNCLRQHDFLISHERSMTPLAKVHATYVLGILLMVIIVLFTVRWGGIPDLVKYVSFALTTTSLLLAVLAIAYSIYANTSLSSTLSHLSASASTLSSSVQDLQGVSARLTNKVDDIPTSVEGVTKRIEDTHALLKRMSERADEPVADPRPPGQTRSPVASFAARSSSWGLMGLYACKLANKKGVGFDPAKVASAVPFLNADYVYGFLVAASVAGMLEAKSSHSIITVRRIEDDLASAIDEAVARRIEKAPSEGARQLLIRAKTDLERYFG